MNNLFQTPFIGDATFDTFRHQFVGGVIGLEVAIGGTFRHRAQGTHTAVRLVRTALIEFDFARRLFGTRQHRTDHDGGRARGNRFRDIAGETDTAVGDNRDTRAFQRFNRVGNGGDLRNAHAGHDTGRTDGARADTHFHRAAAGFRQRASARTGRHVAADDLQVRVFSASIANTLQYAFRVAVRGVDQQNIYARGNQRINALFVARARANRRANAQATLLIFTGVRFTFCFLEIFNGDHAEKMEAVIHNQRFLNAFLMHFGKDHFAAFAFANGHQTLFRRHINANRLIQVGDETHIATGDNADQLVVFGHHRIASKTVAFGQYFDFAQGGGWQDGLRVGHHAGFMLFHAPYFFSLAFNRHVFMNKADAAFLCQGNCQTRFSHGIHCSGKHRNIQTNGFRQLSAEIGGIWQNG